ncbi:MAG: T9SS type A sorting domain-containing protein [Hymenobacter sp.]|nr:MAG: T9SS type A sorting domain-containing protein [Hymenobacter sp.]
MYVTNSGGPCGPITTWFSFYYPTTYSYAFSPNPVMDDLMVQAQPEQSSSMVQRSSAVNNAVNISEEQAFIVELYNSQGMKVVSQSSKAGKAILNVRSLPNGLYNLRIGQGKEAKMEHIQVVH